MTISQQGQMNEATFIHKRTFLNFMNDIIIIIICIGVFFMAWTKPVSIKVIISILETAYNTHFLKRIILFFVPISIGAKIILEGKMPVKDMKGNEIFYEYEDIIFSLQVKHIFLMVMGMFVAIIVSGFA